MEDYTLPKHLPYNVGRAVALAIELGTYDGDHHKMWVIDQMLQELLGDDYQGFLDWYNSDEEYSDWDQGIAP